MDEVQFTNDIIIEDTTQAGEKDCKMKPIERGLKEAVTRDGRKVTQLTWFDDVLGDNNAYQVAGVINGHVGLWTIHGKWINDTEEHELDILAPVEYEWQWLIKDTFDGACYSSGYNKSREMLIESGYYTKSDRWIVLSRIEESKRECK